MKNDHIIPKIMNLFLFKGKNKEKREREYTHKKKDGNKEACQVPKKMTRI